MDHLDQYNEARINYDKSQNMPLGRIKYKYNKL